MATAFVRALATVLMMGGVAVLYRYRAVLAALFCTRGRRPARSPPTPRAFGSARRLEARPGPATRPRAPQLPACRRGALPPPSGTAAARIPKGCPAAALGHRSCPHAEGVPCRRPRAPQSARAAWSPHHPPRPRSRPCARAGSRSGYTHTKSPGPNGPGDSPSGWRDLNPRPLRPERSALPSCATPRCPMSIAIPRRKTQTEIGGQWEVCATPQR